MKKNQTFALILLVLAICLLATTGCEQLSGGGGNDKKQEASLTANETSQPNQNPTGYSGGYDPGNLQGVISQRLNLYPVDALTTSRNEQWRIICAYLRNIEVADCRKLAASYNEKNDRKNLNNILPNQWLLASRGDFFLIDLGDLDHIRFKHYRSHGDDDDAYRAPDINSSDLKRYSPLEFINKELPRQYGYEYKRFLAEFNSRDKNRPAYGNGYDGQNPRGDSGYPHNQ